MIRPSRWKDTFDPKADFVVRRKFLCNGRNTVPGEPFDKECVRPHTLKSLFTRRDLAMKNPTRPQDGYTPTPGSKPPPEKEAEQPPKRVVTAQHKGFGKYSSFIDGALDKTGLTKAEAEAIVLAG